jgi:hypothetical protein
MMGNNIIRAEGKAKFAMVAMIPAIVNYIRYYFYKSDGIGDVWRSFSYVHFLFYVLPFVLLWFCVQKRIKTESKTFYITPIIKEITALSFVTFQDKA